MVAADDAAEEGKTVEGRAEVDCTLDVVGALERCVEDAWLMADVTATLLLGLLEETGDETTDD